MITLNTNRCLLILLLSVFILATTTLQAAPTLVAATNTSAVNTTLNKNTGKVNFLAAKRGYRMMQPQVLAATVTKEQAARSFLAANGAQFGINNQASELAFSRATMTLDNRSIQRFKQIYNSVPVWGAELVVDMDSSNNLISVNGDMVPDLSLSTTPTIQAKTAQDIALQLTTDTYKVFSNSLKVSTPELIVFSSLITGMPGPAKVLAWKVEVSSDVIPSGFNLPVKQLVIIDANTEQVIIYFNQIASSKNRSTYSYNNTTDDTGKTILRSEGQAKINEKHVDNAHDYAGDTYQFYYNEHGRDSLDNKGLALISGVHYDVDYCNAFWNGSKMTYGDGCFITVDDVVAHELTHGVTQYMSGLNYFGESGAINEAFSDIWGEFVDLTNGSGTDTDAVRWLQGEDVTDNSGKPLGAVRNMKNPPAKSDPDAMMSAFYTCDFYDNGGVHTNSGVANKLAYLITDGDSFNGYTITGLDANKTTSIDKAAKLFYDIQLHLTPTSNYSNFFTALDQACINLGYTSAQCTQVHNAGLAVQLDKQKCFPIAAPSNLTATLVSPSVKLSWTDNSLNEGGFLVEILENGIWKAIPYSEVINGKPVVFPSWIPTVPFSNVSTYFYSGLAENVSYSFRVKAATPAGYSGYSNVIAITIPITKPKAPSNLTATAKSSSGIDIAWIDNSSNELSFKVSRKTGATGSYADIGQVTANLTSFSDSNLTANTYYCYKVRASNSAGDSADSVEACATTQSPQPPTTKPNAASNLSSSGIDANMTANLSWKDNSDNESGFIVQRSTDNGTTWATRTTTLANVTTYSDSGLLPDISYSYRIISTNSVGNADPSNVVSVIKVTRKPDIPANFAASVSANSVTLSWSDVGNEDSYTLERKTGSGTFAVIATPTANSTTYLDSGVQPNTAYVYRIMAVNKIGTSAYSPEVSVTTGNNTAWLVPVMNLIME